MAADKSGPEQENADHAVADGQEASQKSAGNGHEQPKGFHDTGNFRLGESDMSW